MTVAALMRARADALELSVGNETATEGLLTAKPALTFLFRLCRYSVS